MVVKVVTHSMVMTNLAPAVLVEVALILDLMVLELQAYQDKEIVVVVVQMMVIVLAAAEVEKAEVVVVLQKAQPVMVVLVQVQEMQIIIVPLELVEGVEVLSLVILLLHLVMLAVEALAEEDLVAKVGLPLLGQQTQVVVEVVVAHLLANQTHKKQAVQAVLE